MKGVSAVIATILMLVITIALAGVAYMYMSGILTAKMQGIEVADHFCSGGTVTLTIRNIGTNVISAGNITVMQTAPTGDTANPATCCSAAIDPGRTATYTDSCSGTGGRSCIYRLTPPVGLTIEAIQYCT
jgi:flagellin-like protein